MSEVRTPFGKVGFAIWWLSELRHREEVCAAFTEAIDFAVKGGSFEVAAAIRDLREAIHPGWETEAREGHEDASSPPTAGTR